MAAPAACPCGSGQAYAACCGPLHGGAPAADAQALMRSRYSAYALGLETYLLDSWHPSTRPAQFALQAAGAPRTTWLGLRIHDHRATGADTAEVAFVARYRIGGASAARLTERSRFVREAGRWYYLDAVD